MHISFDVGLSLDPSWWEAGVLHVAGRRFFFGVKRPRFWNQARFGPRMEVALMDVNVAWVHPGARSRDARTQHPDPQFGSPCRYPGSPDRSHESDQSYAGLRTLDRRWPDQPIGASADTALRAARREYASRNRLALEVRAASRTCLAFFDTYGISLSASGPASVTWAGVGSCVVRLKSTGGEGLAHTGLDGPSGAAPALHDRLQH